MHFGVVLEVTEERVVHRVPDHVHDLMDNRKEMKALKYIHIYLGQVKQHESVFNKETTKTDRKHM